MGTSSLECSKVPKIYPKGEMYLPKSDVGGVGDLENPHIRPMEAPTVNVKLVYMPGVAENEAHW